jgi:hypothetical protein
MSAPDAPGAVAGGTPCAAGETPGDPFSLPYPHIFSSHAPLLPTPATLTPCFIPLGATVPLPRRSRHRGGHRRRSSTGPAPSGCAAAVAHHQQPTWPGASASMCGNRAGFHSDFHVQSKPVPRPASSLHPGVSFCELVLRHFHMLIVPAPVGSPTLPGDTFWIRADTDSSPPSSVQVQNALNFSFSRPFRRESYCRRCLFSPGCQQKLGLIYCLPWLLLRG